MPGHYSKSGASKGAKTIDPFNSKSTESGKVNDDERHNPFTKDGKTRPGDRIPVGYDVGP